MNPCGDLNTEDDLVTEEAAPECLTAALMLEVVFQTKVEADTVADTVVDPMVTNPFLIR